jgi:hypothetical protein
LLVRWDATIDSVADGVEVFGEARPPLDCHTHEHDVRHALGRLANRDCELMSDRHVARRWPTDRSSCRDDLLRRDRGRRPRRRTDDLAHRLTAFEMTRPRFGRRTADQVGSWTWSDALTDDELAGSVGVRP